MRKKISLKQEIVDTEGKVVGKMDLNSLLFDGTINMALLCQVVNCYIANQKSQRCASTKTRANVRGSGRKPWRQKGTGRARVGEIRNPLWRKGGVVFGPHPRKVYKKIPKKMKTQALKSALNAKFRDKELVVLDKLEVRSSKTKESAAIMEQLKFKKRVLFVDKSFSQDVCLSAGNVKTMMLKRACDLNAYNALNCKNLVLTKDALSSLEERIINKEKK